MSTPNPALLHGLLDEARRRWPYREAVLDASGVDTYRELTAHSIRTATTADAGSLRRPGPDSPYSPRKGRPCRVDRVLRGKETPMADWPHEFDVILRRHCQLSRVDTPIDPDAMLTTLGMDSLDVVEFILSIEDTFDLSIPQQLLTPQTFATPLTVWNMVAGLRMSVLDHD